MVPVVARTPTCDVWVNSPMRSTVGRITPKTLLDASIVGRLICWMLLRALAEAVLQASMTNGQPNSNNFFTAWSVNS